MSVVGMTIMSQYFSNENVVRFVKKIFLWSCFLGIVRNQTFSLPLSA